MQDHIPAKHGVKLLGLKVVLGALAAVLGMLLMRAGARSEMVVALFVGLVPGIAERSPKKLVGGAVLALIGYTAGAQVGLVVAKSASGVPLGHWAVTGGCIGLTAGMSRYPGQAPSPRIIGAASGVVLGAVFGILGDIGGFFTVPASTIPLFYYLREVSLICAGIFINVGAAFAVMLAAAVDRSVLQKVKVAEEAKA